MHPVELGSETHPANDNAVASYLETPQAERAQLGTTLSVLRLAKCAPLTARQLLRLQSAIESA